MRKVNEKPFSDFIAGTCGNQLYLIGLFTLLGAYESSGLLRYFHNMTTVWCDFLKLVADECQPGFAFSVSGLQRRDFFLFLPG